MRTGDGDGEEKALIDGVGSLREGVRRIRRVVVLVWRRKEGGERRDKAAMEEGGGLVEEMNGERDGRRKFFSLP